MSKNDSPKLESIAHLELKFDIIHVQLTYNEEFWLHDQWVATINGEVFKYNTGIGHRKPKPGRGNKRMFNELMRGNFIKECKNYDKVKEQLEKYSQPVKPGLNDILASLVMDAECANDTHEDFCANLGYDVDSRKGLDIYLACQKIADQLRKLGVNIEELSEELYELELM